MTFVKMANNILVEEICLPDRVTHRMRTTSNTAKVQPNDAGATFVADRFRFRPK